MLGFLRDFLKRDLGQDLAEYCLLTALLALIAAGILYHVSGGMQNLWTGANTAIQTASATGNGGSQQTGTPAGRDRDRER